MKYRIQHVCCDGAGSGYPEFDRCRDAISYAECLQRETDKRGNAFGYRYIVRDGYGQPVHETTSEPLVAGLAKDCGCNCIVARLSNWELGYRRNSDGTVRHDPECAVSE